MRIIQIKMPLGFRTFLVLSDGSLLEIPEQLDLVAPSAKTFHAPRNPRVEVMDLKNWHKTLAPHASTDPDARVPSVSFVGRP